MRGRKKRGGGGAEPEGEGRREGLRLSGVGGGGRGGGRDCSDSAPSGLRAGPMGWLLTCGPQVLWTALHPLPPSS